MPEIIVSRNLPLKFADGALEGEPILLEVRSPLEVSILGINLFTPYISDQDEHRSDISFYNIEQTLKWKTALNLGLQIKTETMDVRVENFRFKTPRAPGHKLTSFWNTNRIVDYASIANSEVIVLDPNENVWIIPHRILGAREYAGPIRGSFDLLAELDE